jgi:RimJ/RimL family protein N-acetyltransferase
MRARTVNQHERYGGRLEKTRQEHKVFPEECSMKNPFLIGEKIYLRPLEREDAPLFVIWLNDVDVTRTLMFKGPLNRQMEEAFLDNLYQDEHRLILGIIDNLTNTLIGATGLEQIDFRHRHAKFGIFIGAKNEWGKGYGTEATRLITQHAFMALNLNRVWLHVVADNRRGIRAYERVGFKREGVLRQDHFREGRYYDTIAMAILREEWETKKPRSRE